MSIDTCVVPSSWKCSRITPLHKGGDSHDFNNYRPISIINCVVKLFEKLVFNQLSHYINEFDILSPYQSGFRSNFSTTTSLIKFTNDITSSSDNNMLTGAIFIDLTKAFDMVDHYLLLDKLHAIGLSESSLLWFNSYLHHRYQCVSLHGTQSDFMLMEKGIPQGSSFGPLLFSIFINDLPQACFDCQIHLYADDTAMYTSGSNIFQIQSILQLNFDYIQKWFSTNKLLLNKKKSYNMLFGTRQKLLHSAKLSINYPDGTPLEEIDRFKYLGVWLDSQLTFKVHIDSVIKKINCSLGLLYCSINCFTLQIRKKIVTQLILPILDYADIVYQNTSETNLSSLKVTYNNLCRFILRCPYRTHHCTMYHSLNWLTPEFRRQFHWLQFIFKCIYYKYPPYLKQYLTPYRSQHYLRHTDSCFFFVLRIQKEIGRFSFQFKAPSDWNTLPNFLKSITSFHLFRKSLFIHLQKPCSCF
uniref:Reverse transcriptase domain-containing protein n=1 Tax=Sparus aurata TaxID=8175 RepID=A0A671Z0G9_SPAAU